MNNWGKYTFAAVIIAVAGLVHVADQHRNIPADLRDAVADNGDFSAAVLDINKDKGDIPLPKAAVSDETRASGISNAYIESLYGALSKPTEWVTIAGGKFMLGTANGERSFSNTRPNHEVTIKTFDMSKTAVTVEQYAQCVIQGQCTEPRTGGSCNWGKTGRQLHPVNCVSWDQADQYAKYAGVRLPSESEWEYAARSGGKTEYQYYPWGKGMPTCDKAVVYGHSAHFPGHCGNYHTQPVCSKPAGNTEQGLCDMVGNVWQWVQDSYQNSYNGAPADGSALEGAGPAHVVRGGAFDIEDAGFLQVGYRRGVHNSGLRFPNEIGFRLARSK